MSNPSSGNHKVFNHAKKLLALMPNLTDEAVARQIRNGHSRRWSLAVVHRARRELKEEKAFLFRKVEV